MRIIPWIVYLLLLAGWLAMWLIVPLAGLVQGEWIALVVLIPFGLFVAGQVVRWRREREGSRRDQEWFDSLSPEDQRLLSEPPPWE